MEASEQRESLVHKLTRTAGKLMREVSRQPELVPIDRTDEKAVCNAVRIVLEPQVTMAKPVEAREISFTLHDVVDALGHQNAIDDLEKIQEYEQVRMRARRTIDQLVKDGILEDAFDEEPDSDGETISYALKRDQEGSVEDAYRELIKVVQGERQLNSQAA